MLENYQVVTMPVSTVLDLEWLSWDTVPWELWHLLPATVLQPLRRRFSRPLLSLSPPTCLLLDSRGSRGHQLVCKHPAAQLPGLSTASCAMARPCTHRPSQHLGLG